MNTMKKLAPLLAVAGSLTLAACGTMNDPYQNSSSQPAYSNSNSAYSGPGVVQSIELVRTNPGVGGTGVGVGAIAGAVVGGILGNQVGDGSGQTIATVAGVAGGAYAGHQLERQNQVNQAQGDAYRLSIRMDNGSNQTVMQNSSSDIRVGDRVQIDNGVVRRR